MKRIIVILALIVNLTLACSLTPQAIDAVEEVIPIVENVIQELVTEEAAPSVVIPTDTSNQVESEPIPGNLSEGLVAHFSFHGEVFEDQSGLLRRRDLFNFDRGSFQYVRAAHWHSTAWTVSLKFKIQTCWTWPVILQLHFSSKEIQNRIMNG